MPNPTKEQIDAAKQLTFQAVPPTELELLEAHDILVKALSTADSYLTALRSLVRRMREALTSNSLWPAEVDALCAEADKALDHAATSAPKES